jgi:glycosyltransferase involved in cell wall biosynthesis
MSDAHSGNPPVQWIFLDHCAVDGGAQISLKALCSRLKESGHRIIEIYPSSYSLFPLTIRSRIPGLAALFLNSLYCIALSFKHSRPQWYCNSFLDRLQCAFIPPSRVVTHVRDLPKPWQRLAMRFFPSRAYVVSSEFMRKKLAREVPDACPIHVIPNVVEGGEIPFRVFTDPPLPLRVLMVANLVPWKKHEKALEAVSLLASTGFPICLDIWGSDPLRENGPYRERLLRVLSLLPHGIANLVEGKRIQPEDFSRYHCLLHPAEGEPFGRVLVEAMLGGLPILGLYSGNTREFIEKYSAGIIFPTNEPDVIAGALVLLSSQYRYFHSRASRNRERLCRDFSANSAMQEITLSELMHKPGDNLSYHG